MGDLVDGEAFADGLHNDVASPGQDSDGSLSSNQKRVVRIGVFPSVVAFEFLNVFVQWINRTESRGVEGHGSAIECTLGARPEHAKKEPRTLLKPVVAVDVPVGCGLLEPQPIRIPRPEGTAPAVRVQVQPIDEPGGVTLQPSAEFGVEDSVADVVEVEVRVVLVAAVGEADVIEGADLAVGAEFEEGEEVADGDAAVGDEGGVAAVEVGAGAVGSPNTEVRTTGLQCHAPAWCPTSRDARHQLSQSGQLMAPKAGGKPCHPPHIVLESITTACRQFAFEKVIVITLGYPTMKQVQHR